MPEGWTLREVQRLALEKIAEVWAQTDVLVLRAPVGAGKSLVAYAVGRWAGSATLCAPTNGLVGQYLDSFPELPTIPRGSGRASATARAVVAAPVKVVNYWSYLAHRAYSDVVVFDEAHRLIPTLQDMEAVTVWTHLVPLPPWVFTAADLLLWAEANREEPGHAGRVAKALYRKLRQDPGSWTLTSGFGEYRGNLQHYVRLAPLTPRHNRPVLWPPKRVKKLVFVSATFHYEDLVDLGLEGRRVRVVDVPSPIDPADRPVLYTPVASPRRGPGYDAAVGELAAAIKRLLDRHPERGFVHVTYALARDLAKHLNHPRLRWHDQTTRVSVYQAWLRDPEPGAVMIGAGMAEGIDLVGDLCRWQAVATLPWPDLGDPAVAAKAAARPDWYAWATAQVVQQAVGRSSRGPGDWSVTYILDSSFGRLYTQHRDMFPAAFQAALRCGVL